MGTDLRTDGEQRGAARAPWEGAWDQVPGEDAFGPLGAEPTPPAWDARPGPPFSRVRRGYDADEVDAYVADLERRLAAAEARSPGASGLAAPERQQAAVELGTVLLDARDAADRIRTDAEVAASELVAEAERAARDLLDDARRRVEDAATTRRDELDADLRHAQEAAGQLREATTRAVSQISEWRGAALVALERVVAALEQWPGTVPDPVSLEDVLGPSGRPEPDVLG